ncbi:MAG: flagella basal body P-ring formation protein FlgA [Caulobacterales bacterium]
MKRGFQAVLSVVAAFGFAAQAFAADVKLKPQVTVEGSEIRLGDLFEGAGDAGLTVFGMAPGVGRSMSYSAAYVQAKAKQAGLVWDNAEGLGPVTITRSDGATEISDADEAASFAREASNSAAPKIATAAPAGQGPDLKRGDSVQILYRAPGIQLITVGKAVADARIGGKARATNARSNKTIDGVLVAPGRIEAYSMNSGPAQVASLDGAN